MRLRVGIKDDVDLDTPLVGAHQRPRHSRRIQGIEHFEVSEPVAIVLVTRTPLALEIGHRAFTNSGGVGPV